VGPHEGKTGMRPLPRWLRNGVTIVAALAVVTELVVGSGYMLLARYEQKVKRTDLLSGVPSTSKEGKAAGSMNFLVLGADHDSAANNNERAYAIMIIHVRKDRKKATVLSIPRDTEVSIPPAASWKGGKGPISVAYAYGGPKLVARLLYGMSGIPLDGAFVLDFQGARKLVDAVGGVKVCLNEDVRSATSLRVWRRGCSRMDGETALAFMRDRKTSNNGSVDRALDQQLIFKALLEEMSSSGTMSNPVAINKLLSAATKAVTIDDRIRLSSLAVSLRDLRSSDLRFITVPSMAGVKTRAGTVVPLDEARSQKLFSAIRTDNVDAWLAANSR
jgi:LCP family protein required for cell wall assembly